MQPKIEHANITVSSIAKTQHFLQTAFPHFQLRGQGPLNAQPGRWAHIGDDACYIALSERENPIESNQIPYSSNGFNHLGFVVDNLDEIIHRLEAANYQSSSDSEAAPHRRRSYYTDGNGIEWEFIQYSSQDPKLRNNY